MGLMSMSNILVNKYKNHKREYNSWYSMKQRCLNTNKDNYSAYGGRGIKICDRWIESFDNFLEDMGNRPEGTTLDRIDSNGNYEPSNCKWSTYSEQTLNTSSTKWIDDNGEKICLSYFSKKYGISRTTVRYRLDNGLSLDELKEKPEEKLIYEISYKGKTYSQREIAKEFGLSLTSFRRKRNSGLSVEDALIYCFGRKGIVVDKGEVLITTKNFEYKELYD